MTRFSFTPAFLVVAFASVGCLKTNPPVNDASTVTAKEKADGTGARDASDATPANPGTGGQGGPESLGAGSGTGTGSPPGASGSAEGAGNAGTSAAGH